MKFTSTRENADRNQYAQPLEIIRLGVPPNGEESGKKQNVPRLNKGEEVGGIVPHLPLKSIANNEPPEEEVLVDRPEADNKITRVTGTFCVDGTIHTPVPLGDQESKIQDLKFEIGENK